MHLRTLFQVLAVLGTLLAIHTVIQARTGVFLFGTEHLDTFIAQAANNHLSGYLDVRRAGSFFVDPDWTGTFFSMTLFIPLGLLIESSSLLAKVIYLIEAVVLSLALLFTYSTGSWLAASIAAIIFLALLGGTRYRAQFLVCLTFVAIVLLIGFFSDFNLLSQHSSDPTQLSLRAGAWQTAIRIIQAFPLTGIGLGFTNYLQRAEPYRVPAQLIPLAHPHNSYLELGAMAGLPVLAVFLALLLFALWQAWRNWMQADRSTRCLLAGGIASIAALSVNSASVNGWTLPPIAAMGWLVLGATASPLITRKQPGEATERKNPS